jgi:Excreted virulence factor EspC, type VII ESX diderm
MARIDVDTGALGAAHGSQASVAAQLTELRGVLAAAGSAGSSGAGHGAGQAIAEFTHGWDGSLAALADSVGALAWNLGAAADAYHGTDRAALPEAPR